ncbi:hypothetical protein CKM354_000053500 [Cercospora kikuchii]|uniref:Uncharacterized protein n=1 Tax=Cercospora kikuchii TaxID=84275 RepID=A0A9P3C952_9PEZI|nr:uncharacterized protein CKM354_000053500 [Cercospora kikuchii]GIZ37072.1 hypothetical protein CKM354_000053500 [Cercospora kikuchii]
MSSDNMSSLRTQALANAKMLLKPATARNIAPVDTSATLVETDAHSPLDVVIFGNNEYTAAVMKGLTPAIEGETAPTPELAMRKLLIATCELLQMFMPKVGSHQRNIHGGGVFDESLISSDLIKAT